jgi:hypothetical protein
MENVVSEIFSPQDMNFNAFHRINGYLATPSGKFKYYDFKLKEITPLGTVRN